MTRNLSLPEKTVRLMITSMGSVAASLQRGAGAFACPSILYS